MRRTFYLVIFVVLIATFAFGGYYYRQRAAGRARPAPPAATPACDTPAPPPQPKTPPPKLPDFSVESGCDATGNATKPAAGAARKKQ